MLPLAAGVFFPLTHMQVGCQAGRVWQQLAWGQRWGMHCSFLLIVD
jgi:hypothetical protein